MPALKVRKENENDKEEVWLDGFVHFLSFFPQTVQILEPLCRLASRRFES